MWYCTHCQALWEYPGVTAWGHIVISFSQHRGPKGPDSQSASQDGTRCCRCLHLENCVSQVGKGNYFKGQRKKRKLLKFKAYASGSRKFTRQVLNYTFLWSFKNASRLECEIRELSGETCHIFSAFHFTDIKDSGDL